MLNWIYNFSEIQIRMSRAEARDHFAAIADPTRRAMLARLRTGALRAGDLAEGFALSQPALSKHLRILREAGLVRVTERGRERLYALDPHGLSDVVDWVAGFEAFWPQKLEALGAHLRGKANG
jgi:DNA-binding transcriptional ArsR family regulator